MMLDITVWTNKAVRPAKRKKILTTIFLGGESALKIQKGFGIVCRHLPKHYRLWQVESSEYPEMVMPRPCWGRGKCACTIRLQLIAPSAIISSVKAKHVKTLRAIFAKPTLVSIAFGDIESLLVGMGVELSERKGSRVKFSLRGEEWHAHRPHPGKEAKKYQVEGAREFLERLEIKP